MAYDQDKDKGSLSGGAFSAGDSVQMCGRSVMGGWFSHWGWDWDPEDPVSLAGWDLYYHEMDSPPEIVDSAKRVIRQAGRDGVVFFKLCFADFAGGDQAAAEENLAQNKAIVDAVVKASQGQAGQVLLLGNALPVVKNDCDRWMVENQRAYNDYLKSLESMSSVRIVVVDLYGALSTPDGCLDPSYASDPYDSHPNEAGYDALDPVLRSALGSL